ncbi:MAG: pseudouridine synthase [Polyangiaceae bacterium]
MELPTPAVLYEDRSVMVVDKPSGLAVHPGYAPERDTLVSRLRRLGPNLSPVHRLDRGTSGVVLVAKDREAARALGEAFASGGIEKRYVAWVRGVPPDAQLVEHPIPKDEGGPKVDAATWVYRLQTVQVSQSVLRERRYSLVEARPLTGRFHQIRRHLKHLGNPILGDTTYGRSEHNAFVAELFGLNRLALHAISIAFESPSGGRVEVESPNPFPNLDQIAC